jgi:uncharacterized protein YeaO (DUF488 family)
MNDAWSFSMIAIKRVYEARAPSDGFRVLVDRLWPRGLRKEEAFLDDWAKAIAPSEALRKWFAHDPSRYDAFRERYEGELAKGEAKVTLDSLAQRAARQRVTLLYAARDEEHNNAAVLAAVITKKLTKKSERKPATTRLKTRAIGGRNPVS